MRRKAISAYTLFAAPIYFNSLGCALPVEEGEKERKHTSVFVMELVICMKRRIIQVYNGGELRGPLIIRHSPSALVPPGDNEVGVPVALIHVRKVVISASTHTYPILFWSRA